MKLTAQEEYGLRCLLQVARKAPQSDSAPVSIREVADAEGLSLDYAAKLLRVLRQGGLLTSERGAQGGYRMARLPTETPMAEVMQALDTPMFAGAFCEAHVGQRTTCVHSGGCTVKPLWRAIEQAIAGVLKQVVLADLLMEPKVLTADLVPQPATEG